MRWFQPANGMRRALSVERTGVCLNGCTSSPPSPIQSQSEGCSKRLLRLSWSAEKTRRCPAWRRVVSFQVSLFAHPLRGLLRSLPGNSAGVARGSCVVLLPRVCVGQKSLLCVGQKSCLGDVSRARNFERAIFCGSSYTEYMQGVSI